MTDRMGYSCLQKYGVKEAVTGRRLTNVWVSGWEDKKGDDVGMQVTFQGVTEVINSS